MKLWGKGMRMNKNTHELTETCAMLTAKTQLKRYWLGLGWTEYWKGTKHWCLVRLFGYCGFILDFWVYLIGIHAPGVSHVRVSLFVTVTWYFSLNYYGITFVEMFVNITESVDMICVKWRKILCIWLDFVFWLLPHWTTSEYIWQACSCSLRK